MSEVLKLEYKVGAIEFRAEGPADAVEQQRINFMNAVLPAAVDAMVRTQSVPVKERIIEAPIQSNMLDDGNQNNGADAFDSGIDYSRTSLASFLKPYGSLSDQDFTLFAAYFDELKNGNKAFSVENVRQYYQDGRRQAYSNNSELLRQLARKGYIMNTDVPEGAKAGSYYMLTNEGIAYISSYTPKEHDSEKKPRTKIKKATTKYQSAYDSINADDLDLGKYPVVKTLSGAKEKVIMAMYIITNEEKGEWFTVDDVSYILENIFGVTVGENSIQGVFKRNKNWFSSEQDPANKKALRRRLLSAAKDFAVALINGNIES